MRIELWAAMISMALMPGYSCKSSGGSAPNHDIPRLEKAAPVDGSFSSSDGNFADTPGGEVGSLQESGPSGPGDSPRETEDILSGKTSNEWDTIGTVRESDCSKRVDDSADAPGGAGDILLGDALAPAGVQVVQLSEEDFTNEPILVGSAGMGVQFDNLIAPSMWIESNDGLIVRVVVNKVSSVSVPQSKPMDGLDDAQFVHLGVELNTTVVEQYYGGVEVTGEVEGVAGGMCKGVQVEGPTATVLYIGSTDETGYCVVPFLVNGTTYVAKFVPNLGCTYEVVSGDELILFGRENESGSIDVLFPIFVSEEGVYSPCVPVEQDTLAGLVTLIEELL